MWLKWDFAPAPFTSTYVLGFVITAAMLVTIGLWVISGCPRWKILTKTRWHIVWLAFLSLFTIWTVISQFWAFDSVNYAGISHSTALQMVIVAGFAIVVVAASPSPKIILAALVASMFIHGAIGSIQAWIQSDIGLGWFGEFDLDIAESGISVLESGGVRWLRPYGLLPHPNILAGILVLGLLASARWILASGWRYILGSTTFVIGFWFLLLTFSRGAWVGFTVGILFALSYVIRRNNFWRKMIPVAIATIIVGLIFVAIYNPLLLSRVGVGEQNTEMRSVSDRIVFMDIAQIVIREQPFAGIGAGKFSWYASNYIFYNTDFDLPGNNVHNIYLGIFAELGFVGMVLFLGMFITAITAVWRQRTFERVALLAGFIAWVVMGIFDHFMWTLILTQMLWMSILAVAMSPETNDIEA